MAILIVDDEAKTREALRNLLSQLGHRVVLEAKNGVEALIVADSEKNRVKMVISDSEMPNLGGLELAEKIAQRSFLGLTPFLLMASDVPALDEGSRVDSTLNKPFRIAALAEAMNRAYQNRCSHRNQILWLGGAAPQQLRKSVRSSQLGSDGFWRTIETVSTPPEFKREVQFCGVGAVFVDPMGMSHDQRQQWSATLSLFKKTPLGIITPVACLSREPEVLFQFRTLSQFFFNREGNDKAWEERLLQIKNRIWLAWEMSTLFQSRFSSGEIPKIIKKMIALNPNQSEVHIFAGDFFESQGQIVKSLEHFQKAIELDPCAPKPYIKTMKLLPDQEHDLRAEIARQAQSFCPRNLDIQKLCSSLGSH